MLRIFIHPVNDGRWSGAADGRRRGNGRRWLGRAIATEPQRLPAMHRHASM